MHKSFWVAVGCWMALSFTGWSDPVPGPTASPSPSSSPDTQMSQPATDSEARPGWFTSGETPDGRQGKRGQRGQRGEGMRKRMAKFDTNGDGKLDDSERSAAKAEMMKRFDTNGDGQVDDGERSAAKAQFMQKHKDKWARFDTNGDGQLDESERSLAKAEMIKRFDTDGDGKLSRQERQAIRGKRGGGKRRNRDGGAQPSGSGGPLG